MFEVNASDQLIYTDELKQLLNSVQKQGNQDVTYREDIKTYGVEEKWAYPKQDGLKLVGDCEDIAIYKRKLLVEAGVPSGPLLLTICLAPDGGGHCVLSVVTDKNDYILCNMHSGVVTPSVMEFEGFKFLYRQKVDTPMNEKWDILT